MNRIIRILTILICSVIFFSCQDVSLFDGNGTSAEIITPEDGLILSVEDEIPIELFFEDEVPSSFSITLLTVPSRSGEQSSWIRRNLSRKSLPLIFPRSLKTVITGLILSFSREIPKMKSLPAGFCHFLFLIISPHIRAYQLSSRFLSRGKGTCFP